MNITPWRHRESALSLPDFEDLFKGLWTGGEGGFASHLPAVFQERRFAAVNVAETEDTFSVTLDCPGLEEKDIQVETMGGMLVISGERRWEEEKKGKEFHRVESQFGQFERRIQLPENASSDADEVEASYKKGVLTITVPKTEKTPAARIPVRAG